MEIISTSIQDLIIIKPKVFEDNRGYFSETFRKDFWEKEEQPYTFLQDNEAKSDKNVLRGLHYQTGEFAQAKLVRVITGSVYDVVVDLRDDSPDYGKWFGIELSASNRFQLFVPRGFAHGYYVLEDNTIFSYKCDNYYHREAEGGIHFADPNLAIDWPFQNSEPIVSEKDHRLPYLGEHLT